jgi:hypothetical protein
MRPCGTAWPKWLQRFIKTLELGDSPALAQDPQRSSQCHAAGADWQTTTRLVLSLDLEADLKAARAVYHAHLARARRMTRAGYQLLLK